MNAPTVSCRGRANDNDNADIRETPMTRALKPIPIALTGLLMLCVFGTGPAAADPYRWCAQYSADADGGTNCYFITLEQCQATISGVGGFCRPNNFYTGPATTGDGSRRSRNRATR
jgi:hypothetical protein